MQIIETADALAPIIATYKVQNKRVGFVPTMGALHEGHLSLIKIAKEHTDIVVVSIFVNPTQFAPHEDFGTYPRNLDADAALLEEIGADIIYAPDINDIYPSGPEIRVRPDDFGDAAQGLETIFRPHFFDGVATVVSRLFDIVKPDIAVFGEKDYQQLMVIREMVVGLSMDIEIIGAPIARDEHGLALSSRNAYLSAEELEIARKLNVVLRSDTPSAQKLLDAGFDKVDYIEERWGRRLAAAWLGKTRLIDNISV